MYHSPLIRTIIEQASEPLHCLHGAGYFTSDEWIKLDLIMNKKRTWTIAKSTPFVDGAKNAVNFENKSSSFFNSDSKKTTYTNATSLSTSEKIISDKISPISADSRKYVLTSASLKPSELQITDQDKLKSLVDLKTQVVDSHLLNQSAEAKTSINDWRGSLPRNSSSRILEERSNSSSQVFNLLSTWSTNMHKNSCFESTNHKNPFILDSSSQPRARSSQFSKICIAEKLLESNQSNVNISKTKNETKWKEQSPVLHKTNTTPESVSDLIGVKYGKVTNTIVKENKSKNISNQTLTITSHPENHDRSRILGIPRLKRHKVPNDYRASREEEVNTKPKARVCWYWAESSGGCRYRSSECPNLHGNPIPGPLSNSLAGTISVKDSLPKRKVDRTSLAPKSKTCWLWATSGRCDKRNECKNVHGWVLGGIETPPQDPDSGKESLETPVKKNPTTLAIEKQRNEDILIDLGPDEIEISDHEASETISISSMSVQIA